MISENYKNACLAAESFDNVKIINAGSISAGLGMQVVKAATLAIKGKSVDEIIDEVNEYEKSIITNFLIPSVDLIANKYNVGPIAKLLVKNFNFSVCYSIRKERIQFKRFYSGYFYEPIAQYVANNFKNNKYIDKSKLYIIYSGYTSEERHIILEEIKEWLYSFFLFKKI